MIVNCADHRVARYATALTVWVLATLVAERPATAVTQVATEAVNIFNPSCSTYCTCGNLCTCVEEADDFSFILTHASYTDFTSGIRYIDWSVWDTDFLDPDASGRSPDNDTYNSDYDQSAIGFFSMHGTCNDISDTYCLNESYCSAGGACIQTGPNNYAGLCAYSTPRYIIVGDGEFDQYNGDVNYSTDYVRWGESPQSGGWAGAAENGNLNWAFVDVSCGVRYPFFTTEIYDLFAGLHGLGICMPTSPGSDTGDTPDRGYYTAYAYAVNHNASVAGSWLDSLASDPQSDGAPCPVGSSNYDNGGGHGYLGCGANTAMSVASTAYVASGNLGESWVNATNDSHDAIGDGYYYYEYLCNYDCNTWPPAN